MLSPDNTRVLETLEVFSPLGIRFWDPVLDRQVADGLSVRAWPTSPAAPTGRPGSQAHIARASGTGIYAFARLPGVMPGGDASTFVVHVTDTRRRYLPLAFRVTLPLEYSGVYPQNPLPSGAQPKGVPLYSASTRDLPHTVAVVRAWLWDAVGERPARHGRMVVSLDGGARWTGLSDGEGRCVVAFPYPDLPPQLVGSPAPSGGGNALFDGWEITAEVHHQPSTLLPLSAARWPDIGSVLDQARAEIAVSPPATSLHARLRFGRELVLRTQSIEEDSRLRVAAVGSPT